MYPDQHSQSKDAEDQDHRPDLAFFEQVTIHVNYRAPVPGPVLPPVYPLVLVTPEKVEHRKSSVCALVKLLAIRGTPGCPGFNSRRARY